MDKPTSMPLNEALARAMPGPFYVLPDPEWAGKHPYHDCRHITTFPKWDEVDSGGSILCSMRDTQQQRIDAALLVHCRNHFAELVDTLESIATVSDAAVSGHPVLTPASMLVLLRDAARKAHEKASVVNLPPYIK